MKYDYDPEVEGQHHAFISGGSVRRRWHWNKLRLFEVTGIRREDTILDAGCGVGNLAAELAPHCRSIIGCDYHHGRLAFARGRGQGTYIQGTIAQLPFTDDAFDKIFCMEVLEHVDPKRIPQILQEFRRILKPGGLIMISTPNYTSLWPVIEFFMDTLRLVPTIPGGAHICKYNRRMLEDALASAGFAIRQIGSFNHLSPFVAVMSDRWAERLYRWELKKSRAGGNLLYALCEKS